MSVTAQRSEIVLSLFESYYTRVFCFVRKSLPPNQAEDIAQEVFIRLLEHKNLESLTISVSYLIKIADNLIKRRHQRLKRFARYVDHVQQQPAKRNPSHKPIDQERQPIESDQLEAVLNRLNTHERDAVRFIVCEGMSYEAAARTLGVSVTTVNNWKFRGLRKLQQYARPMAGEEYQRRTG